jgi:hypothetical protein
LITELSDEKIYDNWCTLLKLCNSISAEERRQSVTKMVDAISEQLLLAPASAKRDFHNAFPGGLVDHSLRVLRNAVKYSKAMNMHLARYLSEQR